MPFAETPNTKALLARLEGVNLQKTLGRAPALEAQKLTRMEASDAMQSVCLEAIQRIPESSEYAAATLCLVLDYSQRCKKTGHRVLSFVSEAAAGGGSRRPAIARVVLRSGPLAMGRLLPRREAELVLVHDSLVLPADLAAGGLRPGGDGTRELPARDRRGAGHAALVLRNHDRHRRSAGVSLPYDSGAGAHCDHRAAFAGARAKAAGKVRRLPVD